MNLTHIAVMQLIVGYTCVGVFVATALAAVLELFGFVKLDPKLRVLLRRSLIVEVVIVAVAFFAGLLKLDPRIRVDSRLEPQMQGFVRDLAQSEGLVQCAENDPCSNSKVLACLTSADLPTEVPARRWLWLGTQPTVTANTTPQIEFGVWTNAECNVSGSGWHAKIGTCGTGRGQGYQRCVAVMAAGTPPR